MANTVVAKITFTFDIGSEDHVKWMGLAASIGIKPGKKLTAKSMLVEMPQDIFDTMIKKYTKEK